MVRDSTHRPRKTEEILRMGAGGQEQLVEAECDVVETALVPKNREGTEEEYIEDSDGDTITQHRDHSLDEEIQSTIDELQRNSLTLREVQGGSGGRNDVEEADVSDSLITDMDTRTTPSIIDVSSSRQGSNSNFNSNFDLISCTTSTSSSTTNTTTNTNVSRTIFYQADEYLQQQDYQQQSRIYPNNTDENLTRENPTPPTPHIDCNPSNQTNSCLSIIEAPKARINSRPINQVGIPILDKDRLLFSESVQHMQRWRHLQGKLNGDGDSSPNAWGKSSTYDTGYGAQYKDKGRDRWRKDSADGMVTSSSLTNVKLPRPRSWVNNLLTGNSALFSGSSSTRQRYHSLDVQSGTPSRFRGGADLMPVSSLVLQNEFSQPPMWSSNPREAHRRLREHHYNDYEVGGEEEEGEVEEAVSRYNRKSIGTLQAATQSTPNLGFSPSSSNLSWSEKPPLMVRNLDDAPRGSYTPSIPPVKKKMTNPWNKIAQEINVEAFPLHKRGDLIDAEEEEAMMNEAVARERRSGIMAEEERAVLDMLDQMNDNVDTFERPTVSRAQSRAGSSMTGYKTGGSDMNDKKVSLSLLQIPAASPTRLSVKAVASALEQGESQSRSGSPVRGDAILDKRLSKQSLGSRTSRDGGVMQAVLEREKLDSNIGGAVGSLPIVRRKKPNYGSDPLTREPTTQSESSGSMLSDSSDIQSSSPQRKDFRRQDSTSTSGSYASQTNAFLNRRATHTADKHLSHSPSQSSYVSSGHESGTTFWSRPGHASESSPFTSPDLPLGNEDKQHFRYGFGKVGKTGDSAPLMRRMLTNESQATSINSVMESSSSPSKQVGTSVKEQPAFQAGLSMSEFQTPTKATARGGSIKSAVQPVEKENASPSRLASLRPAFSQMEVNSPEAGVSPGKLGTPKRAKDLIRFYEQNSAPNSPQLTTSRNNTPAPAVVSRYKQALASSSLENQIEVLSSQLSQSLTIEADAVQDKIVMQSAGRQRTQSRALVGIATDEQPGNRLLSSYPDSSPSDDEENMPVSYTAPRSNGQRRTSRQASHSFFEKVSKTVPDAGINVLESTGAEYVDAIEPRSGGGTYDQRESSSTRKLGSSPFRNGMNRIASALSPGVTRGANIGSNGGSGRQSGTTITNGLPSSHLSSSSSPPSHRAKRASKSAHEYNEETTEEGGEQESLLSSPTRETTHHQGNDGSSHLQLETEPSIEMAGPPGTTPFRTGFVYYFNVHASPALWQLSQAVLLPRAIALSWIPVGGGRTSVVLDLSACRDVKCVSGPEDQDSTEDVSVKTAREQGLRKIRPWQLVFDDGVERLAVESTKERLLWVGAVWSALGSETDPSMDTRNSQSSRQSAVIQANSTPVKEKTSSIAPQTDPPSFLRFSDSSAAEYRSSVGTKAAPSALTTDPSQTRHVENIDRIKAMCKSEVSSNQSRQQRAPLEEEEEELAPPLPPKKEEEKKKKKKRRFVDDDSAPRLTVQRGSRKPSIVETNTDQVRSVPVLMSEKEVAAPVTTFTSGQNTAKTNKRRSKIEISSVDSHLSSGLEVDDEFGPPSPRSEAVFGWSSADERELLPADSASQRPARSQTSSSRFTAVVRSNKVKTSDTSTGKTPAQTIRDSVMEKQDIDASHAVLQGLQTVTEETASQADAEVGIRFKGQTSQRSLVTILPVMPQSKPLVSQAIQTPAVEDRLKKDDDLAVVLEAIKENEQTRLAQHQQQVDIARYLNELNSWLEKDIVDRSKEWRTLALGVTQLHHELNSIKMSNALRAVDATTRFSVHLPAPSLSTADNAGVLGNSAVAQNQSTPLYPNAATLGEMAGGGPSGPRAMPGGCADFNPVTPVQPPYEERAAPASPGMPLTRESIEAMALGVNAPAPIASPGPSPGIKKSGTRTWRAEAGPGPMRNNDVWSQSGTVKNKKLTKEEKKADARARRRHALTDTSLGRIALAAGSAALIAAATHEYDKYKEKQRSEGKPEESSKDVDEKTGTFVRHDEVPEVHAEKIKEAVEGGNEEEVRKAIKGAAEVGAGTAAIRKLMDWIKGTSGVEQEEDGEENKENVAGLSARMSDGTTKSGSKDLNTAASTGTRTAKSSGSSFVSSDASDTLRDAVQGMSAAGGGGALALAVEEILKHLLEKKEEEKKKAKEEAEAEAAREAKRKAEEESREQRLLLLREQEKSELVETILSKLQQEKALQAAEVEARQKDMDPKSAIESLVSAINQQRVTEAAQQASAGAAIKQMAADLVRTTSEQNGKMVEAVHGAAREMLRHNVEAHAEELKRMLSKEVSSMFEDVGKIREAKRALESEIADLFSIKSRHLADVSRNVGSSGSVNGAVPVRRDSPVKPMTIPVDGGHPIQQTAAGSWAPPMKSLPQPMPSGAPTGMPMVGMGAMGAMMLTAPPKRDLVGPFSVNFGPPRRK